MRHPFLLFRLFEKGLVAARGLSVKAAVLMIAATSACCLTGSVDAHSQQAAAAIYSRQQLISFASEMRKKSDNSGATSDALERHLDASTILAVRIRSGRAELHTTSADEFFVIDGHATLVTGGTVVNPRGNGEVRGDSIEGGVREELKYGDVVHIPANTPHQLLLEGTDPFVYVLVKTPIG